MEQRNQRDDVAIKPVDYSNPRYRACELGKFTYEVLKKIDLSDSHTIEIADYIIATDLRGILSHGTRQLPDYVKSFQTLRYNSRPNIKIYRETVALLQWDGDGGIEAERETEFKTNGIPLDHKHVQFLRTLGLSLIHI